MNNAFILKQAKHFAARLQAEAGATGEAQVSLAYRLAYGRPPTSKEAVKATAFVRQNGLESLCWALFNSSEFLYLP
jgi:hypothetical protein